MPLSRRHVVALAGAGMLLVPGTARAQDDSAIAEQLFRDGRALMEAGKTDEACEKFASSQRLAPALGTKLNLALCREKQGKTATAWSLFSDVESEATRRGDPRANIAHDHEAALAPQLKKVVIEVPSPPPGMVIKLDGTVLPSGALGTEIPLDPGDHDLLVTAPGKTPWEQAKLSLGPSATTVHVRVELTDETLGATAAPPPQPAANAAGALPGAETPQPAPEQPPSGGGGNTKRTIGFVIGGAGVVALGVAGYYGLTAISRKNDESKYPAGSQDRLTVYNQASTAQTWGFVLGGIGVAALGTGLFLVLTSHGSDAPAATGQASWHFAPAVGPSFGGAQLQRSF
jgi:hypothetical protein